MIYTLEQLLKTGNCNDIYCSACPLSSGRFNRCPADNWYTENMDMYDDRNRKDYPHAYIQYFKK